MCVRIYESLVGGTWYAAISWGILLSGIWGSFMLIMPDMFASHPNVYPRLRQVDGTFWRRCPISYNPLIDNVTNWARERELVTEETLEGIALRALITLYVHQNGAEKTQAGKIFFNLCRQQGHRWGVFDWHGSQAA